MIIVIGRFAASLLAWPRKPGALAVLGALAVAAFGAGAQAQPSAEPTIEERITGRPAAEIAEYVTAGMKAFDVPGVVIGIVANDALVYAQGFGVRAKSDATPVDARTVFQIGSTTKAFLAATMAIMVDRGKLRWDARVIDLVPDFQLADPWVTREFRVFDLLAQRSGLPSYANDLLGLLGLDEAALIRSLRHVEPISSFRSAFAYTNVTHMLAGRVVAEAADAKDWNAVLQAELLDRLGMRESSYSAAAIEAAPNHARGHRWTPAGSVEIPFTQVFPYDFGGAGAINSTLDDTARWVRLLLADGVFAGSRIVSAASLAYTRTPKVALASDASYALGWLVQQTRNGSVVWHNGGTNGFGAFIGFVPDKPAGFGVIVLSNATNTGLPDAIGLWILDRLLGNPVVDHAANKLKAATAAAEAAARRYARPAAPRPAPPLAPFAGRFAEPSIGAAVVAQEGDALTVALQAGGATLRLEAWDGEVFVARLQPAGRMAPIAEALGPDPLGFVQFQMDRGPAPELMRLSVDNGQVYVFRRE